MDSWNEAKKRIITISKTTASSLEMRLALGIFAENLISVLEPIFQQDIERAEKAESERLKKEVANIGPCVIQYDKNATTIDLQEKINCLQQSLSTWMIEHHTQKQRALKAEEELRLVNATGYYADKNTNGKLKQLEQRAEKAEAMLDEIEIVLENSEPNTRISNVESVLARRVKDNK